MFIILCITLLVYTVLGRPTKQLIEKLHDINWSEKWSQLSSTIRTYGEKAGRIALKPLLLFFYAMQSDELSTLDRCLIYGGIAYIILPSDLMPTRVLGWLGILDDAAIMAFIYKKLDGKITEEVQNHAQATLDDWFGAEVVEVIPQ